MWSTLALTTVLALAPAQGALKLENARSTYGLLGAERTEGKIIPGDMFYLAFDISGLTVAEDGRVLYSMGMQLTGKDGKVWFKSDPKDLEDYNSLGGTRMPAFALTEVGRDTPPGEYTLTVTVTDRAAKKTETLVKRFEVGEPSFGFVRFGMSFDHRGEVNAPPLAMPGQNYWVNFALVGFKLDDKMQPNLVAEMRVLDESGKPTLGKPVVGEVTKIEEQFKKLNLVPMQFVLKLNRPGRYTMQLIAKDNVSKKTATMSIPFAIADWK
jgi:hypothetical protein